MTGAESRKRKNGTQHTPRRSRGAFSLTTFNRQPSTDDTDPTQNRSLPRPRHVRHRRRPGGHLPPVAARRRRPGARSAELPYSIRVLLESVLRNCDGYEVTEEDVQEPGRLERRRRRPQVEIPFKPARVVLQDFTGVPAVVDLAAMRSAMQRLGGDPKRINPLDPGRPGDRPLGAGRLLRHARRAGAERRAGVPAATASGTSSSAGARRRSTTSASCRRRVGIVHQVNLEYLAKGVFLREDAPAPVAVPDTLVGTDSHTTMINGLGVVGWGVGGIEAEAVMLGQPLYMLMPEVIGFELTGQLPPGATATDLVLTRHADAPQARAWSASSSSIFGPGVSSMTAGRPGHDRQHGARVRRHDGLLPRRRRDARLPARRPAAPTPKSNWSSGTPRSRSCSAPTTPRRRRYTKVLALDLGTVEPSLAGPKRPQDRVPLRRHEAVVPPGRCGPRSPSAASPWPRPTSRGPPRSPTNGRRDARSATAPS